MRLGFHLSVDRRGDMKKYLQYSPITKDNLSKYFEEKYGKAVEYTV
jgi:hypothetical protein